MFPTLSAGTPVTVNFCLGVDVAVPVENVHVALESVPGNGILTRKDVSGIVISPLEGKVPSPELR
jgi:hypothetical protein